MAATFQVGQYVDIPCDLHKGAFPGEYLVTLDTRDGPSSGFVQTQYVNKPKGCIRGIVRKIDGDTITVQFPGSFFTTAMGLTTFPVSWANENVTVAP